VPLLTRMVGTPLAIDIGPGAIASLAPLLADRRISSGGHVAIAVGPGQGEEIAATLRPQLGNAEIWTVEGGTVDASRNSQSNSANQAAVVSAPLFGSIRAAFDPRIGQLGLKLLF